MIGLGNPLCSADAECITGQSRQPEYLLPAEVSQPDWHVTQWLGRKSIRDERDLCDVDTIGFASYSIIKT